MAPLLIFCFLKTYGNGLCCSSVHTQWFGPIDKKRQGNLKTKFLAIKWETKKVSLKAFTAAFETGSLWFLFWGKNLHFEKSFIVSKSLIAEKRLTKCSRLVDLPS